MGLKDLAKADKYLTTLASMDLYLSRHVGDLLERLHRMQEEADKKGGGQGSREDQKKDDEDEENGEA